MTTFSQIFGLSLELSFKRVSGSRSFHSYRCLNEGDRRAFARSMATFTGKLLTLLFINSLSVNDLRTYERYLG